MKLLRQLMRRLSSEIISVCADISKGNQYWRFAVGTKYQIIIVDYLLLCFNFSIQSKIRIRIKFKRIIHRVIFASDIDFVRRQGEDISEQLVKQH